MKRSVDVVLFEMAKACIDHLSPEDAIFVGRVGMESPERMAAYLSAARGKLITAEDFAALALSCAKRIRAGGET